MISYIASYIIPVIIVLIIIVGIVEKKNVLELFSKGVLEGLQIVLKIFPYILAIYIGVNLLRETKAIDILIYPVKPLLNKLGIPKDIVTLGIIRPMSGGASTSIVMDIFNRFGPDSIQGKMASIIMGGTETGLYVITILLGTTKIKEIRGTLIIAIVANIIAIILSIFIIN